MADSASGWMPGLIRPEECVLVIVDVQEKLLPSIWKKEQIQANIVRLASFCSIMHIPVLVSEQVKLGKTIVEIRREVKEFQPLVKEAFNCFAAKAFRESLSASGKKQLIVAGIESHVCVMQTAVSGVALGYRVQVVMDATSSRSELDYQLARDRFHQSGVVISSTEAFFFEAMQRAGTAEFKQALPFIK
ncbi:MAG: isochorismatase family protein [Desulfohalobiaceae bacterium]|nr:isochorismatase family protein [Desulfohalobiaceae bacterium]